MDCEPPVHMHFSIGGAVDFDFEKSGGKDHRHGARGQKHRLEVVESVGPFRASDGSHVPHDKLARIQVRGSHKEKLTFFVSLSDSFHHLLVEALSDPFLEGSDAGHRAPGTFP